MMARGSCSRMLVARSWGSEATGDKPPQNKGMTTMECGAVECNATVSQPGRGQGRREAEIQDDGLHACLVKGGHKYR